MKNNFNKIVSLLLSCVLIITMLPINKIYADELYDAKKEINNKINDLKGKYKFTLSGDASEATGNSSYVNQINSFINELNINDKLNKESTAEGVRQKGTELISKIEDKATELYKAGKEDTLFLLDTHFNNGNRYIKTEEGREKFNKYKEELREKINGINENFTEQFRIVAPLSTDVYKKVAEAERAAAIDRINKKYEDKLNGGSYTGENKKQLDSSKSNAIEELNKVDVLKVGNRNLEDVYAELVVTQDKFSKSLEAINPDSKDLGEKEDLSGESTEEKDSSENTEDKESKENTDTTNTTEVTTPEEKEESTPEVVHSSDKEKDIEETTVEDKKEDSEKENTPEVINPEANKEEKESEDSGNSAVTTEENSKEDGEESHKTEENEKDGNSSEISVETPKEEVVTPPTEEVVNLPTVDKEEVINGNLNLDNNEVGEEVSPTGDSTVNGNETSVIENNKDITVEGREEVVQSDNSKSSLDEIFTNPNISDNRGFYETGGMSFSNLPSPTIKTTRQKSVNSIDKEISNTVKEETKSGTESNKLVYVLKIDSKEYSVDRNGENSSKQLDASPFIENSRTMFPVRYFAELLGAKVDWNNTTRTIVITKGDLTLTIAVDGDEIKLNNGKIIKLDVVPRNIKGRVFLPLTNIAEAFDLTVGNVDDSAKNNIEWNEKDKSIVIELN